MNIPAAFFLHFMEQVETMWHQEYMILYLLNGTLTVSDHARSYDMQPEDILAFSPLHVYTVSPNDNAIAAVMLTDPEFLCRSMPNLPHYNIEMFSGDLSEEESSCLLPLRRRLANLFQLYYRQTASSDFELSGQLLLLYDILFRLFGRENEMEHSSGQNMNRLKELLQYAKENFHNSISLESAADALHVSVSYLTRYFTAHMGISFMQYIIHLRLNAAANALRTTHQSVTEIAYEVGFSTPSALISKFRDTYGCTPKSYRRKLQVSGSKIPAYMDETLEPNDQLMKPLFRYADTATDRLLERPTVQKVERHKLSVDTGHRHTLQHIWKRLLNVGWAKDLLTAVIQDQLRRIQTEIGFQYLRFHGIFDDNLFFCTRGADNRLSYNFTYIDFILDFMGQIQLLPYFELGFMPKALAGKCEPQFTSKAYICMPTSISEWRSMVRVFILHCIDRYGIRQVRTWRFTPISCIYVHHNFFTIKDYLLLFDVTYHTLKEIDQALQIGGPGIDISIAVSREDTSFQTFMEYCETHACKPDFITCQCFPYDLTKRESDFGEIYKDQNRIPLPISDDTDFVKHNLKHFESVLKPYSYVLSQLAVECWGSTFLQTDPCNDTCYKSAYLIRNLIDIYDSVWCMGYWMMSDYTEDVISPTSEPFHGGFGLFTYNGLRKSGYQALRLLNRLEGKLIGKGQGWIASITDTNDIFVLTAHYGEYHALYRNSYISQSERENPYLACISLSPRGLTFLLENMPEGDYEIEARFLNRENGSVFDEWVKMGRSGHLTTEQLSYLQHLSEPGYHIHTQRTLHGTLEVSCLLQPHECRLVRISQIHSIPDA